MPRGQDYRIPLKALFAAAERHQRGESLRSISRLHWHEWGYSSPGSALEGLRYALRSIGAPVRGRIEQTVLSATMHGNSRRAFRDAEHPEHERHLEHRRMLRAKREDPA